MADVVAGQEKEMILSSSSYYYAQMLVLCPLVALLLLRALRYMLWPTDTTSSGNNNKHHFLRSRRNNGVDDNKQQQVPPSPAGLPIIGHLHLVGEHPHVALRDLAEKHGGGDDDGLMLLRLGGVRNLVVSSARAAEAVMRTHDHALASRPRSTAVDILLRGSADVAFAPYGERWRQSRKLVTTHLLTAKKVRSFRHARHDEARLAVAKLRRRHQAQADTQANTADMSELLYSFANDVVCRAVSGKFFVAEGRNQLFRELIEANSTLIAGFNIEDYFPSLLLAQSSSSFGLLRLTCRLVCRKAHKLQQRWHHLLDKLIDAHQQQANERDTTDDDDDDDDFIHVLLSLQQDYGLTRNQMKAILMDMFGAGTDTSYLVMEYAMAELMRNPHAMAKLQEEVRTNTPTTGQDMVMEDNLANMTYLKAVIKETLRLHPPAPLLLPRQSMADCTILGYMIPAQTRVIINAWAISRDPRSWDRAEEFMPERFMAGSSTSSGVDFKGNDFQFTPFGAGRRICPGLNFGLATVEIMLASLIYCFDWDLPTGMTKEDIDMTDVFGLTLRRKDKLFLVPKPIADVYY